MSNRILTMTELESMIEEEAEILAEKHGVPKETIIALTKLMLGLAPKEENASLH